MRKTKNNQTFKRFFFQLESWIFVISALLIILAVMSARSVYMEGQTANQNAQSALQTFEDIVLKNDVTDEVEVKEPVLINDNQDVVETVIEVEAVEAVEAVKVVEKVVYSPIAKIQADKIDLNVSVLSEWSYELLDISVNKFSGPDPNEAGNFIVIGHNYLGNAHFGNLNLLQIGDLMTLTDLTGRVQTYEVYETQIIKPDEVEKLMSDQVQTLTLITCDDDNAYRLVVKSSLVD